MKPLILRTTPHLGYVSEHPFTQHGTVHIGADADPWSDASDNLGPVPFDARQDRLYVGKFADDMVRAFGLTDPRAPRTPRVKVPTCG
jgi:hypothetical protein